MQISFVQMTDKLQKAGKMGKGRGKGGSGGSGKGRVERVTNFPRNGQISQESGKGFGKYSLLSPHNASA